MAKLLPVNFRKSQETAVATYNYTDIASGTGFVIFYAGKLADSNVLSSFTFYSDNVLEPTAALTATTYTLLNDDDYDVMFNTPRAIEGNAIITVPMGMYPTANDKNVTLKATVTIRKWDGTTETDIATNDGVFEINGASSATLYTKMTAIDITVPRTSFKAGETLRLTIAFYGKVETAGNSKVWYGHDPKSRPTTDEELAASANYTFSTDPSILEFHCPFKLDL